MAIPKYSLFQHVLARLVVVKNFPTFASTQSDSSQTYILATHFPLHPDPGGSSVDPR